MTKETPVNSEQARVALGRRVPCSCVRGAVPARTCKVCAGSGEIVKPLSRSYMWALKKAMAAEQGKAIGRYFYLSDAQRFLREHPDFNSKGQKGDKALLREVIEFMKDPSPIWTRRDRRDELISKLEAMA